MPALKRIGTAIERTGFQPLIALFCLSSALVFAHLVEEVAEGGTAASDRAILLAFRTAKDPSIPIGPPWLLQSAIDISALGGFTVIWFLTIAASGFLILAGRWRALHPARRDRRRLLAQYRAETQLSSRKARNHRASGAELERQLSERTCDDIGGGLYDHRRDSGADADLEGGAHLSCLPCRARDDADRPQPDLSRRPLAFRRRRRVERRGRLGALLLDHHAKGGAETKDAEAALSEGRWRLTSAAR
ncbi:protein of unknown function [Methylocella tundrae]|uniref:Uncharacterized protein n=1 Tax=Methylocella tundrae TaxID=227605 RepID=A0A4U8Z2J1_METTU|nr:protein of unknown function [Methylocella tundrae]